jgi:hypothetical protein
VSSDRAVYVTPVDFDRLMGSLVNSTGLHIRRAVVVDPDGPLYYDGPVQLKRGEGDEGFKLLTTAPAGEVLPCDIDGWQMKMWPKGRILYLSEGGYYRVQVYDTLKGAVQ